MKIDPAGSRHGIFAFVRQRGKLCATLAGLGVAASALAAAVAAGMVLHKDGTARSIQDQLRRLGYQWRKLAVASEVAPDRLELDLKQMSLERLAYDRERGLSAGILNPESCEDVPAKLHCDQESYNASVRLKGVFPDHWQHS